MIGRDHPLVYFGAKDELHDTSKEQGKSMAVLTVGHTEFAVVDTAPAAAGGVAAPVGAPARPLRWPLDQNNVDRSLNEGALSTHADLHSASTALDPIAARRFLDDHTATRTKRVQSRDP